ncbi:MAG: hypothetical protein KJO36_05800 [Acidimicrobiia bacterium]|nr:hypothetical protein [Acidimicrobiia bacterium]MBT8250214.1 hypothetical protein [Acidimicrobiia bacterium]NNC43098.1 hypothetical protein [Acidimicrobiia bacterium]NND12964.1 hypothetical protein [Acidimicrobiia bacterium]NNL28377.1 hypothetical protein [Acidimicrobiia bacterium]
MRTFLVLAAPLVLLAIAAPASAQTVDIAVSPLEISTEIGAEHLLAVSITNRGSEPTGPLVAHLVVIDPSGGASADAEDWTGELNRPLTSLGAGESISLDWDIKPIIRGDFIALITVASVDDASLDPASSPAVYFMVTQPTLLVSGATVPVSIAVPLIILAIGWWMLRTERKRVEELVGVYPNPPVSRAIDR